MHRLRVARFADDGTLIDSRSLLRSAFPLAAGRAAQTSAWVSFGALAFDDDGRLGVHTTRAGDRRTVFDVFDGGGAWPGEVDVDAVVSEWALGAGGRVGAVESADGMPRIGVWRGETVR